MKTIQAVTVRYASNLIRNGRNKDFVLEKIYQQQTITDNIETGHYYVAHIVGVNRPAKDAVGITPFQAVHRALQKHGVTFR